ncbi:hypothetical protein [Glutamicibacter sp. AOP5-A2-18]|uniref:hypothetical protein n=1 Tax=Glutamicibacter sp. AOP5-A2-18 TaxID=3457656 RepID=UPI004034B5B4
MSPGFDLSLAPELLTRNARTEECLGPWLDSEVTLEVLAATPTVSAQSFFMISNGSTRGVSSIEIN